MATVVEDKIEKKSNLLKDTHPHLLEEWDYEKNEELGIDINKVTYGSKVKVWWICSKCKSSYDMETKRRCIKPQKCPYCAGRRANHTNSLASLRPDLASEWHPTLNGDLTPHDVTCGSNTLVWWKCPKCKSDYDMPPHRRISGNQNCPYCAGVRVNHTNSLASLNPELVSQWHITRNEELTPNDVTSTNSRKVWWKCEYGHEWQSLINDRNNGVGCPYCTNKKVLIGFNDMWTTHPELAKLLLNPEDGYKYTYGSRNNFDWRCPDCGCEIISRKSHYIRENGLSCPKCGDNISFGEKVIYGILESILEDFEVEKVFSWASNKRYDFYFIHLGKKIIIEAHGMQHYKQSNRGRSLEEEQSNDKYKYEVAMHNGIDKYVVIDCRYGDFEWIKNSILKSELAEIFDLGTINWSNIYYYSKSSIIFTCAELWNDGFTTSQIAQEIRYSSRAVLEYLKKASFIGICDYDPQLKRYSPKPSLFKPIVQLTLDGQFIKQWDSIKSAGLYFGDKKSQNISKSLVGKQSQSYGYKWVYLTDYK